MHKVSAICHLGYFLFILLMLDTSCTKPWEEMDHMYYKDDIHIDNLADITKAEEILKAGYNAIDGDVYIEGYFDPSRLDFFNGIYEITGTLEINKFRPDHVFNRLMKLGTLKIHEIGEFRDFYNLISCDEIYFYDCNINDFTGFNKLEELTIFEYHVNEIPVENFVAFQNILTSGAIELHLNQDAGHVFEGFTSLKNCDQLFADSIGHSAFRKLEEVSGLLRIQHSVGENGFSSLRKIKEVVFLEVSNHELINLADSLECEIFSVVGGNQLTSFEGSPRLDSVRGIVIIGCNSITSLKGLKINHSLEHLAIIANSSLFDFCEISDVEAETVLIENNLFNPTLEEIHSGKCKP